MICVLAGCALLPSVSAQRVAVINCKGVHNDVVAGMLYAFNAYFQNNQSFLYIADTGDDNMKFFEAGLGRPMNRTQTVRWARNGDDLQAHIKRSDLPSKVDLAVFISPEYGPDGCRQVRNCGPPLMAPGLLLSSSMHGHLLHGQACP